MKPFEKCPVCGGDLELKTVEKLIRGGDNTAVLTVSAEVCLHCGERLYAENTVRYFEKLRNKLKLRQTEELKPLGLSFEVEEKFFEKHSDTGI